MFNRFACKHPANALVPKTGEVLVTKQDEDFIHKRMTLRCYRCHTDVEMKWASLVGGAAGDVVQDFLSSKPEPL